MNEKRQKYFKIVFNKPFDLEMPVGRSAFYEMPNVSAVAPLPNPPAPHACRIAIPNN